MKKEVDEFLERQYERELLQKQQLDSADTFLVGIIGALLGVGGYYVKTLAGADFGVAPGFLFLFVFGFVAFLFRAVYMVSESIWPKEKAYISSPKVWADYVKGLEAHYGHNMNAADVESKVDLDLSIALRTQYGNAGKINRTLITAKHGYQTKAKRALVAAVWLMLFSALPLFFVENNKNAKSSTNTGAATTTSTPGETKAT